MTDTKWVASGQVFAAARPDEAPSAYFATATEAEAWVKEKNEHFGEVLSPNPEDPFGMEDVYVGYRVVSFELLAQSD